MFQKVLSLPARQSLWHPSQFSPLFLFLATQASWLFPQHTGSVTAETAVHTTLFPENRIALRLLLAASAHLRHCPPMETYPCQPTKHCRLLLCDPRPTCPALISLYMALSALNRLYDALFIMCSLLIASLPSTTR